MAAVSVEAENMRVCFLQHKKKILTQSGVLRETVKAGVFSRDESSFRASSSTAHASSSSSAFASFRSGASKPSVNQL